MSQTELIYKLDDAVPAERSPGSQRSPASLRSLSSRARVLTPLRARLAAPYAWLLPLTLLLLWQLASSQGWAPPQILPAPRAVLETLWELARTGDLLKNLGISLARIAAGFALGSAGGAALGIGMGLSPRFERFIYPTFKAANQVPVLGWLPLAMMLLGIGEALKVVIIAQASLVPVALNAYRGIRAVPQGYLEVARVFEFSRLQLLRKVVLPAAVPSIFVGVRYGLTLAWLSLVTVELLASSEGVGFLIVWGRQLFQLDLVMAAILIVGVVGSLLDAGLAKLEKRLLRWQPPVRGESATGVA